MDKRYKSQFLQVQEKKKSQQPGYIFVKRKAEEQKWVSELPDAQSWLKKASQNIQEKMPKKVQVYFWYETQDYPKSDIKQTE